MNSHLCSSDYSPNSIKHKIYTAMLRQVSLAPQGRNWCSWRSTQEKKKKGKKKSQSQAVPVPAHRRQWELQPEVPEEAAAAQVCADIDIVCPCNHEFHAVETWTKQDSVSAQIKCNSARFSSGSVHLSLGIFYLWNVTTAFTQWPWFIIGFASCAFFCFRKSVSATLFICRLNKSQFKYKN